MSVAVASRLDVRASPAESRVPEVPWQFRDAIRLFVLTCIGLFGIVAGWAGASGTATLSDQLLWVSVAVGGFLVACMGYGLWLLAGRRAVGVRLAVLTDAAEWLYSDEPGALAERIAVPAHPADALVAPPAGTRYHRPACILVRSKELVSTDLVTHRMSGRRPCEVCRP